MDNYFEEIMRTKDQLAGMEKDLARTRGKGKRLIKVTHITN